MNDPDQKRRLWLLALVLFSLFVFSSAVVLRAGIANTPYNTTDSAGRTMGFNDRFSAEHYLIIIGNFRGSTLSDPEYAYEWLLFALHGIAAHLIMSPRRYGQRATRWFFAIQSVLFPFGWVGVVILPSIVTGMLTFRIDREGFVDIPFIWCVAHPVWIIVCLTVALAMPGASLGLSKISRLPVVRFGGFLRLLWSRVW